MAKKNVYFFGGGKAEGRAEMKNLLGGKGANLAEMTNLGIPVPPGFTISTRACNLYFERRNRIPEELIEQTQKMLKRLEKLQGKLFGDKDDPLLVSVRSGAKFSMPGMMDTVLNLGLNDDVIEGIIEKTKNPRFAYDIYRRFIDMFGDVVMGCDHEHFEHVIDAAKKKAGVPEYSSYTIERIKFC